MIVVPKVLPSGLVSLHRHPRNVLETGHSAVHLRWTSGVSSEHSEALKSKVPQN